MPRVGVYLTELQIKKFKEISKKTGLTVSDLIRRSLDDWIERYEEKERKKKGDDRPIKRNLILCLTMQNFHYSVTVG